MADRPYKELGGLTPLEAAKTPVMDRLAGDGQCGFYYPLGPGRVPSTELSHFALFGYGDRPFPGRACLEALGHDVPCDVGDAFFFLALRRVARVGPPDGSFRIVGGYGEDFADAPEGYADLDGWEDGPTGQRFEIHPLPEGGGEAILRIKAEGSPTPPSGDVTDSDPFFFTDLPVLRPKPLDAAADPEVAARTAGALDRFLARAADVFGASDAPCGDERLVVSKWAGTWRGLPAFAELAGVAGASVASTRMMRGLALALGLRPVRYDRGEGPKEDLAGKVGRALTLLGSREAGFAHVHTKWADEVSHAGDPGTKVAVLEELDLGMEALLDVPVDRLVLCVTSDHCTPVGGRTVHWGDSVPILVRGPHVRADGVASFGERPAVGGSLGRIGTADLLPYLLCQADRAHFLGARPLPFTPLGIPSSGEPWLYDGPRAATEGGA